MIGIIDYGMGNLRSVQKAFEHLGVPAVICTTPEQLLQQDAAVLPGVGAFRDAIAELKNSGFVPAIEQLVAESRPLLGICLGLQLLFDRSEEDGIHEGLGIIAGDVVRFQEEPELKIPHMGWNSLELALQSPLLEGIEAGDHVYFVHSYFVRPTDESVVTTWTTHGTQRFVSMIQRGNLFATQFHPEKSQKVGLKLLENFANLCKSHVGA